MTSLPHVFEALESEICRSAEEHPEPKHLFERLVEKCGSLAFEAHKTAGKLMPGNVKALYVACEAMRIYIEGTTPLPPNSLDPNAGFTYTTDLRMSIYNLGVIAERRLREIKEAGEAD